MKARIVVGFAFVLVYSALTEASEWVSIGEPEGEKAEIFIDVSSIRVSGSIRRFWSKMVYPPQSQKGFDDNDSRWVESLVSLIAVNCDDEAARFEAGTHYFEDGSNFNFPTSAYPTDWAPVPPDTVMRSALDYVCVWQREKSAGAA